MKKLLLICCCVAVSKIGNTQTYVVSTAAGNGTAGFVNGSATTTCELDWPYGVTSDGDSAVYFCDINNHAIRKLNINTNLVTTIAGTGVSGYVDGAGTNAKFNQPINLFFKNNILYVSDNSNNRIRQIDLLNNNTVSTIAGSGTSGHLDGPASTAQFKAPNGIFVDASNNIYVADAYNFCIRKISSGQVSTVAGTPGSSGFTNGTAASAKFNRPRDLVVSTTGDIYVTDIVNNVIRKISGGMVSTFAGTGVAGGMDGAPGVATLNTPVGIGITYNNRLYFIDGQGNKLRKVDTLGNVTTIAGNGAYGFVDGAATIAEFNLPQGVCYDQHGSLFVGDRNNNRIRRVSVPECASCPIGIGYISGIDSGIDIYPNPSNGIVNIRILDAMGNSSYRIYNVLGQDVKSGMLNSEKNQLNLNDLPSGVYTVVVVQKNKLVSVKIVVEK
jgi:sugar lactone lactonase YvrE